LDKKVDKKILKQEKKDKITKAQKKEAKKVKDVIKDSEKAIKKVTAKQESAPGGIIDTVTQALAKNAAQQGEKINNRARIETKIDAHVTSTDAAIGATR